MPIVNRLSAVEIVRADALHAALTSLAHVAHDETHYIADRRLTTAWETLHDAYEDLTGYCYADVRDRRSYASDAAHTAALLSINADDFE
ncbi:hypothetical protein POLEWNIK_00100 [Brevundimonas phage vB_BpoS-Polewnik]|nr:hypothetical protein POLEWNIK_00100 [Brevundimonas phage vB_BpoS-Polewnik]